MAENVSAGQASAALDRIRHAFSEMLTAAEAAGRGPSPIESINELAVRLRSGDLPPGQLAGALSRLAGRFAHHPRLAGVLTGEAQRLTEPSYGNPAWYR